MAGTWLPKCSAYHLFNLSRRLPALIDICEVAQRVIPTFLKAEVEDDVLKSAARERGEVLVSAFEVSKVLRRRKVSVELKRAVDRNLLWVDATDVDQIAPNQDWRRLTVCEWSLRIVC